jgi:hypothetical protein
MSGAQIAEAFVAIFEAGLRPRADAPAETPRRRARRNAATLAR